MNMGMRRLFVFLGAFGAAAVLGAFTLSSCDAENPFDAAKNPLRSEPTRVVPTIVSLSPETVEVDDGQIAPTHFVVEYRIANASRAAEAELVIQVPGGGWKEKFSVPIVAAGRLEVDLDVDWDVGPTVRYSARCPGYISEPRIWRGVFPETPIYSTGWALRLVPEGATNGCELEATVNGRLVQLTNKQVTPQTVEAVLPHEATNHRLASVRELEVRLSAEGESGLGASDSKTVDFDE